MSKQPPICEELWNLIPEAARTELVSVIAKKDIWISALAEAAFDTPEAFPRPTFVNLDEEPPRSEPGTPYDAKGRLAQVVGSHVPVISMYYGDEEETTYNTMGQEVPLAAVIAR